MINMKSLLYEMSYETSTTSGTFLLHASTWQEAYEKFDERWSQYSDEYPKRWISNRWSVVPLAFPRKFSTFSDQRY